MTYTFNRAEKWADIEGRKYSGNEGLHTLGLQAINNLSSLSSGHICEIAKIIAPSEDDYNNFVNNFMDGVEG
jgi:hypothetical protein